MQSPEHHLVYVPGLHDDHPLNRAAALPLPLIWRLHGFHSHVVLSHWSDSGEFQPKLEHILEVIGDLATRGHYVSLVGQSAGGSAVINAFAESPHLITGVVNITGRLRVEGEPSLAKASQSSPAFAESVRRCERVLQGLAVSDRARIMTIRPIVDRVVPAGSVPVDGAQNLVAPVRGHSKGGAQIVGIRTAQWMQFLREQAAARD